MLCFRETCDFLQEMSSFLKRRLWGFFGWLFWGPPTHRKTRQAQGWYPCPQLIPSIQVARAGVKEEGLDSTWQEVKMFKSSINENWKDRVSIDSFNPPGPCGLSRLGYLSSLSSFGRKGLPLSKSLQGSQPHGSESLSGGRPAQKPSKTIG